MLDAHVHRRSTDRLIAGKTTAPLEKTIAVTFAWIRNNDGVGRLITVIPTSR